MIFSVGLVCIAACGILPMGGGLSMYAEVNGYIVANDYAQYQLGVIDMFKGRFPSLLALALYTTFVGFRFSPDQPVTDTKSGEEFAVKSSRPPLAPFQEKCGYIIFFLVTAALLFNAPLNRLLTGAGLASLASWEIVLIGAFLMVLTECFPVKKPLPQFLWIWAFSSREASVWEQLLPIPAAERLSAEPLPAWRISWKIPIWWVRYFIWFPSC